VELLRLLGLKNGFFAFESALHVFPAGRATAGYDLADWNDEGAWRQHYGSLAQGLLFFAEDVFGVQFALNGGQVCRFDPETARAMVVSGTVEEWAQHVLANIEVETGYPLAHSWQTVHGSLRPTERLVPKTPFALGGEFTLDNLRAVDAVHGMRFRGDIARQLHSLPPGAQVQFRVVDD
jgi:hypothetical protein